MRCGGDESRPCMMKRLTTVLCGGSGLRGGGLEFRALRDLGEERGGVCDVFRA